MNTTITHEIISRGFSYQEYKAFFQQLVKDGKTSGPDQSAMMIEYTKLNLQRLERTEKTFSVLPEVRAFFEQINKPLSWVLITEPWCGDASQSTYPIAALAGLNSFIKFSIILRDENEEVINNYLTNGGKAIPKLIVLDDNLKELYVWGPRPHDAQQIMLEHKRNPSESKEEFYKKLQLWYAQNRGTDLQNEIAEGLKSALLHASKFV